MSIPVTANNEDLHGNAPDKCRVALLLIDVINDFEFDGGEALLEQAVPMAARLSDLCSGARRERIPIVYVNDNFGRWRSDFQAQVKHCLDDGVRGEPVTRMLRPQDDDYFVLKPKNSGFFSTTLDLLLTCLAAKTLILAGVTTDNCVLFTANDAYLRDFRLFVPADCSAAQDRATHRQALQQMVRVLKADPRDSEQIEFAALVCDVEDSVSEAPFSDLLNESTSATGEPGTADRREQARS